MLSISPSINPTGPLKILCLGAHSDDIEIGCGGTLIRLIKTYKNIDVTWIVFGSSGLRSKEAYDSAGAMLKSVKNKKVLVRGYRDGFFPYIGAEIKDYFEQVKQDSDPDLIFTHYRDDRHQDHRLISDLTWNTFRNHFILEYEIFKYDGDLGVPNFFVDLDKKTCQRKIEHLFTCFNTQTKRHWFTEDTFWGLLRLRGVEANARGKYAEAYYSRKIVY